MYLSLNQVPRPIILLFGALAFTAHLSLPKGSEDLAHHSVCPLTLPGLGCVLSFRRQGPQSLLDRATIALLPKARMVHTWKSLKVGLLVTLKPQRKEKYRIRCRVRPKTPWILVLPSNPLWP